MSHPYDLTGHLLVASPLLSDSTFARTVLYICAHSESEGAMGFIVNRPTARPTFTNLLEQLHVVPNPPARSITLHHGGPIDRGRGFILHSSDWKGTGSLCVGPSTNLTANLEILTAIAEGAGPKRALLALGHAAWAPGQLEREIIWENAWFSMPALPELTFDADDALKWSDALGTLGIDPARFTQEVGHA